MVLDFIRQVQESTSIYIFIYLKLLERSSEQFISHLLVEIFPSLEPQEDIMTVKLQ